MVYRRNIYCLLNPSAFYYVFWPPALVYVILSLTYYYYYYYYYYYFIGLYDLDTTHLPCNGHTHTHPHKIKCKIYINMHLSYIRIWFISFIIYFIPYSSNFELQLSHNYFNFIFSDTLLKLKERCVDTNIISWVLQHNFIRCC
jgi:hypothetical protein